MSPASGMAGWVIVWAILAVLIATIRTSRRAGGVGLVTAFLVNFGMAYWVGAAITLLPWMTRRIWMKFSPDFSRARLHSPGSPLAYCFSRPDQSRAR